MLETKPRKQDKPLDEYEDIFKDHYFSFIHSSFNYEKDTLFNRYKKDFLVFLKNVLDEPSYRHPAIQLSNPQFKEPLKVTYYNLFDKKIIIANQILGDCLLYFVHNRNYNMARKIILLQNIDIHANPYGTSNYHFLDGLSRNLVKINHEREYKDFIYFCISNANLNMPLVINPQNSKSPMRLDYFRLIHTVAMNGWDDLLKDILSSIKHTPDSLSYQFLYTKTKKSLPYVETVEFQPPRITPLFCAIMNGHLNCVKILLEYGANINYQDLDSRDTPLHCFLKKHSNSRLFRFSFGNSFEKEDNQILEALLSKNPNLSLKNNQGKSTLYFFEGDDTIRTFNFKNKTYATINYNSDSCVFNEQDKVTRNFITNNAVCLYYNAKIEQFWNSYSTKQYSAIPKKLLTIIVKEKNLSIESLTDHVFQSIYSSDIINFNHYYTLLLNKIKNTSLEHPNKYNHFLNSFKCKYKNLSILELIIALASYSKFSNTNNNDDGNFEAFLHTIYNISAKFKFIPKVYQPYLYNIRETYIPIAYENNNLIEIMQNHDVDFSHDEQTFINISPLSFAIKNELLLVSQYLIKNKVDLFEHNNIFKFTPISTAINERNIEAFETILKSQSTIINLNKPLMDFLDTQEYPQHLKDQAVKILSVNGNNNFFHNKTHLSYLDFIISLIHNNDIKHHMESYLEKHIFSFDLQKNTSNTKDTNDHKLSTNKKRL